MAKTILSLFVSIYLLAAPAYGAPPGSVRPPVPKTSPWSLLAGPCLLGGWMFIRRRRRKI
jgi:hypothetical protein